MSDDVVHRLSVEGVDPLALAGVNDANLLELARRLGVRRSPVPRRRSSAPAQSRRR